MTTEGQKSTTKTTKKRKRDARITKRGLQTARLIGEDFVIPVTATDSLLSAK